MGRHGSQGKWGRFAAALGFGAVWGICLVGCGNGKPNLALAPTESAPSTQPAATGGQPTKPIEAVAGPRDPRLHQSFDEATVTDLEEQDLPPDRTLTGLSTGKLHDAVAALWDQIVFDLPNGKRLRPTAVLDLGPDFGTVEIALDPEAAPNHVRNFVALARAGYFDGLEFERVVHQEPDGEGSVPLDLVEAGGPLGAGRSEGEPPAHQGPHLGYFLKPEFSPKGRHQPGTVGACRDARPDSAACRFYITLSAAPAMDENYTAFGRVTVGLDAVRKIKAQPLEASVPGGEADRPVKPVTIRKVTIRTEEVDKPAAP